MLSVPNGATSRRLQLPYELAYGLQKLERLVVHIVKRIRHQEEDDLALHSPAADVSPAVAKLWASTWHQVSTNKCLNMQVSKKFGQKIAQFG